MAFCKKCKVEVDSRGSSCPLCNAKICVTADPVYPAIKTTSTWLFVKRLLLFNVVLVSAIVLFLNYMLTPNTKWSVFVIAGLMSMYVIFLGIMKGHKRILSMMFYLCFLIIMMTIVWDNLIGWRGWSINYVLPSLAISYGLFLLVLRFLSHLTIEDIGIYIYLHVLLEFLPLILFYKGIVTFEPLAVISAIFGLINLLILLIFDFSRLKKDLSMRLHI